MPAIDKPLFNFISEAITSIILIVGIVAISLQKNLPMGFGPFLVALLVISIGLSLGGPTGYSINPARDFGPRLVHFLFPMGKKGNSGWKYAWIPLVAPTCGSILAVLLLKVFGVV